MAAQR